MDKEQFKSIPGGSMTYRALYFVLPSALDWMARTKRAVKELAPSGSSSLRRTLNVPRLRRSRTSLDIAYLISGLLARGSKLLRSSVMNVSMYRRSLVTSERA